MTETPVDPVLVEAARAGDQRALSVLVQECLPLVYNVVRRALDDDTDVEDVVQDTLLRVVRGLPELRDPEQFRTWLMSIAVRRVRDHRETRVRLSALHAPLEALDERDPADFTGRTDLELELAAQRREVTEAARWLAPTDRRELALWWQEAAGVISRAELAAASGRAPQTAGVRVQRMKAQLGLARVVVRGLSPQYGCPDLLALLGPGDGRPGGRLLRRLGRHVRRCPRCQELERGLVAPEGLLAGLALLPVPGHLLQRLLEGKLLAAQAGAGPALTKPVAVVASVAAGTVLAFGLAVQYLPLPQPPAAAPATTSTRAPVPTTTAGPLNLSPAPVPSPGPTTSNAAAPVFAGLAVADLYVAPDGDDAGPGSLARPFATLNRAVAAVRPGQSVAVRGGTYRPSAPVTIERDGTAAAPIVLSNYRDERPDFDLSRLGDRGFVEHTAAYWTVQGLELRDGRRTAYQCRSCRSNTFRRLSIHDNARTGFQLTGEDSSGNRILDSDFAGNHDDDRNGADADGLLISAGSGTGNVLSGNRFFDNADDGLDIERFGSAVTIDSNWSFGNGVNRWDLPEFEGAGNGFRLNGNGSAGHVVTNNAAWENGQGFSDAKNPARMTVRGNTAYGNRREGFWFNASAAAVQGNAAVRNGDAVVLGPKTNAERNSWQDRSFTSESLSTADRARAEGPRPPAGGLPPTGFLRGGTGLGASMSGPARKP